MSNRLFTAVAQGGGCRTAKIVILTFDRLATLFLLVFLALTCIIYHPPPAARSGLNMESMLNKLKSTVTKVTADVTSAVMGNPVTREFEVGRHIASGGPGMCWRIYNGTKKSTKQVCVTRPAPVNVIKMNRQLTLCCCSNLSHMKVFLNRR